MAQATQYLYNISNSIRSLKLFKLVPSPSYSYSLIYLNTSTSISLSSGFCVSARVEERPPKRRRMIILPEDSNLQCSVYFWGIYLYSTKVFVIWRVNNKQRSSSNKSTNKQPCTSQRHRSSLAIEVNKFIIFLIFFILHALFNASMCVHSENL